MTKMYMYTNVFKRQVVRPQRVIKRGTGAISSIEKENTFILKL